MRKNHISGKMKQILAVACAAMLAVSSVPANTVAYASETETTQEAEVQNDNKGAGENNDVDNTNESNDVTNETSESGKSEEKTSESGKSGEETSESGKSGETSESGKSGEEASESGKSGEETSESGKSGETSESGKSGETSESGQSGKDNKNDKEPEQDTTNPKVTAVELSEDKEKIEITIEEENISEDGWTYSCKKNGEEKSKTVKANTFTIDPKTEWGEGIYTDFQISGKDASGNPLEFGEGLKDKLNGIKITIDTKAPKVTAVELSEDKEKIKITIEEENISEDGWTYSCKKDGEEKSKNVNTNTFTIDPKEAWGDGTYTDFQISGKDASGKSLEFGEGLEEKLKKEKIVIDTKAPVINNVKVSIDGGEEGDLSEISFGTKIKYTFEVDEPNLETLKYHISHVKIDNTNPDTTNWTTISDHSFTVETDAKGYVYVYAEDAYEHKRLESFKALVVEKTKPLIDFVVTNGDKLNPEVKINKVTDDKDEQGNAIAEFSGIKEVYYTVDGGTEKHYVLKAPATVPTSFDALLGTAAENKVLDLNDVNGKHKLTIHAIDWCGNEGKEETAELLFDHKAPKIDITPNGFVDYEDNNVTKKVTKNGTFDITITDDKDETETDEHTGTYSITVNDSEEPVIKDKPFTSGVGINTSLAALGISTSGEYTIKVTAVDEAGTPANAEEFSFAVDVTSPTVAIEVANADIGQEIDGELYFNKDALEGNTSVQVKFTVTEDHMKNDGWKYSYTVNGVLKKGDISSWTRVPQNGNTYVCTIDVGREQNEIVDGWYDNFKITNGTDVVENPAVNGTSPKFIINTKVPVVTLKMASDNSGFYHKDGGFTVSIEDGSKDDNNIAIKSYTIKITYDIEGNNKKEYEITKVATDEAPIGKTEQITIPDSVLAPQFGEDESGKGIESTVTVEITATTTLNNETQAFDADNKIKRKEENEKTIGTYYYDKVAPRLVSITSKPSNEEAQFKPGVDEQDKYYYVSAKEVTDSYKISDKYLDISDAFAKVAYKKNGEDVLTRKEDITQDNGIYTITVKLEADKVEGGTDEEFEGKFSNFVVSATDMAGNKLVKADNYDSVPDYVNEINDNDSTEEGISLAYGKVLDTVAPKLVSIVSVATEKKFYNGFNDGGDGLYYVSAGKVTDTYTISDTNLGKFKVSYQKDGLDAEKFEGEKTVVVTLEGEGEYTEFKIAGTDKAGNPIKIAKNYVSDPKDVNAVEESENSIALTNGKVLDTTRPIVVFEATERKDPDTLEGVRRYYNTDFNGTFTVTDNYTLLDKNNNGDYDDRNSIVAALYQANEVDNGHYNDYKDSDFAESEKIVGAGDTTKTIVYSKEITADGNYRFYIEGHDKAGNPISNVNSTGEMGLKAYKDGFISNDKIRDTIAPSAVLSVLNGDKAFYKLEMTAANYKLDPYDPYQKKIESKVKLELKDKSPVYFTYKIDSTVKEGRIDGITGGYANDNDKELKNTLTTIPAREQIITIKNLVVKDRAGNLLALDGKKETLPASNKLVFDSTTPTTKPRDIIAPSATIKATSSVTHRNADGRDLFNHAVTLNVTITDPGSTERSSGLKDVSYDVYVDGKKVKGDSASYSINGASDAINETTADVKDDKLTYTKKFTINLPTSYQSNDIEIRVNATDHSGNKMATVKYRCGIDTIGPKITVSYDNNSAQNEKYFKADRTATIKVVDRNVDNGKIHINTQVSVPGSFSYSSGGGNGANDTWTKKLYYNKDGDYTLDLPNCTDALGNKATVTYEGTAPKAFTIDKTIPVIYVTFDNNSSQNGKYYKDPRTATVRIHEHNFRASDVKINQTANIQKGNVSAPGVSGFGGGGDDHSASINYSNDGNYTIEVNYTDLAGNPAKVVKVDEFVIDRTKPVVKFVTPDKNNMVFQDAIAPQIEYSDINTTRGMASISLKGMKKSNVLEVVEDTFSDYQGTVRFENLKKVRENDDIYIATAVVTDLAGNEESVSITFSVNRFGSTYDYNNDSFTTNLVQNYFTNQEGDVVLREINVNKLTERSLTLYKDGDNRKLVEGTDFKVEENTVNGHYEYIYTIFAKNFEEEGNYNIIATSKDEAKNTNSNSSVKGNDGSNEVPLRFAIDKTEPTNEVTGVDITKNKFTESEIMLDIRPLDNMNAVAKFLVRVLDKDKNVLQEFEMSGEELAKYLEEHDGVYQLTVEQNTGWQTIEIVTTDAAGNTSTDYTIADNTAYNVLVTPNLFVQYINRLPLVLLTVAAIAGIIFFFIWKRKKDQEDETAA